MRKVIALILAGALTLSAAGCSAGTGSKKTTLYQKGLDMTLQMDAFAESKEYITLFTTASELTEAVQEIGAQNYSTPRAVFEITGIGRAYSKLLQTQQEAQLDEQLTLLIEKRSTSAVASQLNGASGTIALAASACLVYEDYFLFKELTEQKVYLYLYDGKYGSMVTFMPYPDQIVAAASSIVADERLADIQSAEGLSAYFGEALGSTELQIQQVSS